MRLLTYLDHQDKPRPGCLINHQVIDIHHALNFYQTTFGTQEVINTKPHITIKSLLVDEKMDLALIEKAVHFTFENRPSSAYPIPLRQILFDVKMVKLQAPIPDPGKIICVAMNYPDLPETPRPEYPTVFLKPVSTLSSSQSAIILPPVGKQVQFEGELAFYLRKQGRNIVPTAAWDHIAGYTIANDLGDSLLEKRTSQWVTGKMFDTFTPIGPCLVTPHEIPNPQNLQITTYLNGKLAQQGNTREMLFTIDEIIAYLSTITTLYPGDLILTGSPKLFRGKHLQSAPLRAGDHLEVSISQLGTLINSVEQGE